MCGSELRGWEWAWGGGYHDWELRYRDLLLGPMHILWSFVGPESTCTMCKCVVRTPVYSKKCCNESSDKSRGFGPKCYSKSSDKSAHSLARLIPLFGHRLGGHKMSVRKFGQWTCNGQWLEIFESSTKGHTLPTYTYYTPDNVATM